MLNCLFCVCNKLCTSKAGLTLHQRHCADAKKAIAGGKPATKESDIILPKTDYEPQVKEFIELAEVIAHDAHLALTDGNKSAGRRSRTNLIKLRDMMIPLRKNILSKMR